MPNRIELLAPAGDMDALKAAVQNGADAVYLGAGNFNARRNAGNFEGDALKTAIDYCHLRGVRVHLTLNTLVRQDELPALYETVAFLNESGADAVIVQDFGVAEIVRRYAPRLEMHASTQMAVHNRQGVRFLADQGFDRVVLARELSFEEIASCTGLGVEIETFAHGALCVACSGQCLISSMIGGRSGNRGLCAQPCRLPYTLDAHEGYLLSTRDLCTLNDLKRYADAGVNSLKLEGRLKRAEYVAVTTAAYRHGLDCLFNNTANDRAETDTEALKQMFNRGGFTKGYGFGIKESDLMFSERPNHLGVPVGACDRSGRIRLDSDLDNSDTLSLRRANSDDIPVHLSGSKGENVPCAEAKIGDKLYRTVSEAQMEQARKTFETERRPVSICFHAKLKVGVPAELTTECQSYAVALKGEVLAKAENRKADPDRIKSQLCKTGGTAFTVEACSVDADEDAFVPVSVLNALRRDALERLTEKLLAFDPQTGVVPEIKLLPRSAKIAPKLFAQSADAEILSDALNCGADEVIFAPEDLRQSALDAAAAHLPDRFMLALPPVASGDTLDTLHAWASANAERITVTYHSNIAHFALKWPGIRKADYLLNAANNHTVAKLAEWGVEAFTPSVELTSAQIRALYGKRELMVYGRIPLMLLRHCPLRAVEGMKGPHAACRRCDAENGIRGKKLVDRKQAAFPLVRLASDEGCVIEVLNSATLMPLRHAEKLPNAEAWRVLLRKDDPVEAVCRVYKAAANGEPFRSLPEWHEIDQTDTTTGHYFRGVD